MITRVCDRVWKLSVDSNIYFCDFGRKTLIDTGPRAKRGLVQQFLDKVVPFDAVELVLFTHLHYDHIGNFDLFPNAVFAASRTEIENWRKDPLGTVLDEDMAGKFREARLVPLEEAMGKVPELEVVPTPGHTTGSVCLWYGKERVLFSGDTLFGSTTGRTDLPTSDPRQMQESMMRLVGYNHRILCPGHG
ncbi:MBL fold metallo-hydrolase [Candidatus Woesearchaeota archaeon]|nr:MBL fold metallo-hydrolase [Candidatus Woesearchaeota archaeon]